MDTERADAIALYSALADLYREGHRLEIVTSDGQRIDPVYTPPFIGGTTVEEDYGQAIAELRKRRQRR
jgi:hypothetical protein